MGIVRNFKFTEPIRCRKDIDMPIGFGLWNSESSCLQAEGKLDVDNLLKVIRDLSEENDKLKSSLRSNEKCRDLTDFSKPRHSKALLFGGGSAKYKSESSWANVACSGKECKVEEKEISRNIVEGELENELIDIEMLDHEALLDYSRMLGKLVKRLQTRIPVAVEDIQNSPQSHGKHPKDESKHFEISRTNSKKFGHKLAQRCESKSKCVKLLQKNEQGNEQVRFNVESRNNYTRKTPSWDERRRKICSYCSKKHKFGRRFCEAFGKKCQVCLKFNHIKDACWYSRNQNNTEDHEKGLTADPTKKNTGECLKEKELRSDELEIEKKVVKNDDLFPKAKEKDNDDSVLCTNDDDCFIQEIQGRRDIQWFESAHTKQMMIHRGGSVLTTFLDRFRVLKKDSENKLKDVNPGRKELGIEEVDDHSNEEENVKNEDPLIQVPKRWNVRVGSEIQKWVDFKAEWSD